MCNNVIDSLFLEFYKEKYRQDIYVESIDEVAFISYSIVQNSLHLWELFIKKEYRKSTVLCRIVKKVIKIANNNKCNNIIGYVENSHNSPENIVKLLKILKFEILNVGDTRISFIKKL
jgi:hypothetical protein